jgi:hypothetical protein
VYTTCLFCNKHLGANQVLETFPVGRRVAFDAAKGRLWVVCNGCEKWNLSPFETRWEALEDCERRFCDARKRVSTDNIGLARLDEGLELVRIGEPLRPEFAAWRYGDQFGRRRRRTIARGVGLGALGAAVVIGGIGSGFLAGGGWWIYEVLAHSYRGINDRRLVARIPTRDGNKLSVRHSDLQWVRLLPGSENEGLRLVFWNSMGETVLTGQDALTAIALIIPRVKRGGAAQGKVQDAVRRIEEAAHPEQFLHVAAREADRQVGDLAQWSPRSARMRAGALQSLPLETRLAIEMAINEENERNERAALAGELALLEMAWQEAEEIATIADGLALPREVEERFQEMKEDTGIRDRGGI